MTKRTPVPRGKLREPASDRGNPYKSKRVDPRAKPRDLRWYLLDACESDSPEREQAALRVWAIQERMRPQMRARHDLYLYLACLYDDAEIGGLGPGSYDSVQFEPSTLSFNVVRKIVDTFTSRVAKARPLPMPLTTGGDYGQQRRAKKYGRFIDGQFEMAGVWQTSPVVARDTALFGTGLAHNYRVGKKIHHERVFPWEIGLDAREAMHGKPRNLYLRRYVDRLVLAERFPAYAEKIESAKSSDDSDAGSAGPDTSDLVLVVESWHLPSGELEDGKLLSGEPNDGRHAVCISNACLQFEEYTRAYFPFSRYVLQEPLMGWFGSGFGKQLMGLQYTINDGAMKVQERHAMAGGFIVVDDDSEVSTDHLDNGGNTILRVKGGKVPQWINPQPVHPDEWNFVLSLLPQANDQTGVSQTSTQGTKPPGITSGRALEHLSDEENERFAIPEKRFEDYHVDLAWQFFDLSEDAANDADAKGTLKVKSVAKVHGQRQADDLEWKDARLDRDSFVLQVFPTSSLPKTPGARIDYVQSLSNSGWLTPDEAKMLLDFPDLDRVNNLSQAAYNIVQKLIEAMLDADDPEAEGVYVYPEPTMNLDLCIVQTQQAYLNAMLDGAERGNLDLLLQFIADARAEKKKLTDKAAADAAAAAPPPPPPMAVAPIPGDAPPPVMGAPQMPPPPMPMAS